MHARSRCGVVTRLPRALLATLNGALHSLLRHARVQPRGVGDRSGRRAVALHDLEVLDYLLEQWAASIEHLHKQFLNVLELLVPRDVDPEWVGGYLYEACSPQSKGYLILVFPFVEDLVLLVPEYGCTQSFFKDICRENMSFF